MTARTQRVGIFPWLAVWVLAAMAYAAKAWFTSAATPLILDTDDAMRLTEVHDFLAGQGWWDLVQHRLNTPVGVPMHWSRLVDLPEAALLAALRPLAGAAADTLAAYLWPLLLLGPLLWLTAKLALRLGRAEALWPASLLSSVSLVTLGEFAPGRFDHHSVQILLALAMLHCIIAALDRPRFAIGAGIAAAVAVAVGIESLPIVAVTVMLFALMWVGDPTRAPALRDFGLSFAVAMALGLALGVAPAHWLDPGLDAISIVYVAAAFLCAVAFVLLAHQRFAGSGLRLGAALVAAAIVSALLLWFDPDILRGPYAALDPWLVQNWLSHVAEAQTWLQAVRDDPVYPLGVSVPVLCGAAFAIWNTVRRQRDHAAWLAVAVVLLVGLGVMLVQIRAARIVTPLAVPACAALVAVTWRRLLARPALVPAFAMVAASIASAGLAVATLVALLPLPIPAPADAASGSRAACLQPAALGPLAALPPQPVMAPVDLGSHVLLFTPHSVVGAPYHRDQQGLRDTLNMFDGPIAEARQILRARGIRLVVVCPAMSEVRGDVDRVADSFATLRVEKALPPWLALQSPPGAVLELYAVTEP